MKKKMGISYKAAMATCHVLKKFRNSFGDFFDTVIVGSNEKVL